MRVVIALDSFKGSITAAAAAAALAEGWRQRDPDAELVMRPMADGGEGTLEAFAAATTGAERVPVTVTGPHGRPVSAAWLRLPASAAAPRGTAVVELASTSGIELLGDERSPWDAGTLGFGQAVAAALDAGVDALVLGIGSSASTDGGLGMLTALGARVMRADGSPVAGGARGLVDAHRVDLSGLRPLPVGGALVLSDVTNPLCGPRGAAAVFGPQKGLGAEAIRRVDHALGQWARLTGGDAAEPGTGAAGGTGFGLRLWGASLVPGAVEVAHLVGLADAVAGADLVLTGEGAYDGQSAAGKVPSFVADVAAAAGVPVGLVAGRVAPDADTSAFARALSLTELAGSPAAAMADPSRWLRAAGAALALDPSRR